MSFVRTNKKIDDMNGNALTFVVQSVGLKRRKEEIDESSCSLDSIESFKKMTSLRLRCIFTNITSNLLVPKTQPVTNFQRFKHIKEIPTPKPGGGVQYRRYCQKCFEVKRINFDLQEKGHNLFLVYVYPDWCIFPMTINTPLNH